MENQAPERKEQNESKNDENTIIKYVVSNKVNELRETGDFIADMAVISDKTGSKKITLETIGAEETNGGILLLPEDSKVLAGTKCPYCMSEVTDGDQIVMCKNCRVIHHLECWKIYNGCTTLGCVYNHFLK